jgi:hypothetical protein
MVAYHAVESGECMRQDAGARRVVMMMAHGVGLGVVPPHGSRLPALHPPRPRVASRLAAGVAAGTKSWASYMLHSQNRQKHNWFIVGTATSLLLSQR